VLTTNTLDKVQGVDVLTKACEACKSSIEERKGRLVVKEGARAVTERDDRLLTEQLTALEAANRRGSRRIVSVGKVLGMTCGLLPVLLSGATAS